MGFFEKHMYIKLFLIILLLIPVYAVADFADELDDLIGYTIVDSKTIVSWYDDDEREENSFHGCSYGRVIIFQDSTSLTCAEYGYMYAYRPTAVILVKEFKYQEKSFYDIKMVVEDEVYDMR